jgi:hypothetical protein
MKVQELTKAKNNKEYYDFRVKNDKELKKANGGMQQKAQNSCLYIYNTKNPQKLKKQAIKNASSNG